ncbi:hypothetical protein GC173_06335 [bacterium]|nr:hypothetical protein [bacterium]
MRSKRCGKLLVAALLASVAPLGAAVIDDMEFATDDTAAAAGVSTFTNGTVTVTPRSTTPGNEGSTALGLDLVMAGSAFEYIQIIRTLPAPVTLTGSYSASGSPGSTLSDLTVTIDVKGDPVFDSTFDTNTWILLHEADGDTFRFINFSVAALNSTSWTNDMVLSGLVDRASTSTGDGNLTAITSYTIMFENPDAVSKTGTIVVDDLKIAEPGSGPSTGLTYVVPLIDASEAPNVTDSVFDAIYADGGAHPAIAGDDWKDWASRTTNPATPISANTTDPTAAAGIAANSKAYLISDGSRLYFGMRVYDPNTSLMTADTGNDSFTKWNVESIEVALSALSGAAGVSDAFKVAVDGFSNIDDMMPDGTLATDTSAKTQSNSYIIDANTWATEWSVGIDELRGMSLTNLANPLPAAPGPWYGHIGYQSPFPGANPRVPLYAAGHGNGFATLTITFDLSELVAPGPLAVDDHWSSYR